MKLAIIAAMTQDRIIGKDGSLPWRLPEDLKRFKELTLGHPIIMGRKTWESLPKKPLPGRPNLVLSKNADYKAEGAEVFSSLKAALDHLAGSHDLAFVIGGAALFKEALPVADTLHLTLIQHPFEGDVYFPAYDLRNWKLLSKSVVSSTSEPFFDYEFIDAIRS